MAELSVKESKPILACTSISEYTQETTIHGIKYVADRNRPVPHQIFWITMLIVSFSSLGYYGSYITSKWMDNTVMIIDDSIPTNIFNIPFPAVTICPVIKSDLGNINSLEYAKKYIMSHQVCHRSSVKTTKKPLASFNLVTYKNRTLLGLGTLYDGWMDTLNEISPKHKEVFESCQFSTLKRSKAKQYPTYSNCEEYFKKILTSDGLCYTFNTVNDVLLTNVLHSNYTYYENSKIRDGWDPEDGYSKFTAYPYKAIVKGAYRGSNGLKFVLSTNISNATSLCQPTNIGHTLILHSPSEYPHTYDQYISLEHNTEYNIIVKPKTISTAKSLRSISPKIRNCYFNDERKLRFYTFYNQVNCRLECYANYTTLEAGCVPISLPRDSNTTNCALVRKNYGWEEPDYNKLINDHLKAWKETIGNSSKSRNIDCNCLPECNSIHYEYVVVNTNANSTLDPRIVRANSTVTRTTVEVIFNEPKFTGSQRVRIYTFESYIADFGGLLGLFLGGSMLSLFELIYFLTLRNF